MAKKVVGIIKLQVPAGKANPSPPIGPALGEALDELEKERKKLTSIQGPSLVFTRDVKPIGKNALRNAFERPRKRRR